MGIDAVIAAAEKLLTSVTYDDCGEFGRGGNGGLISRDTVRAADELRLTLSRYRVAQALSTAAAGDGAP